MIRPGGYAIITGPDGVIEMDTFTCGHHNGVVHLQPGQAMDDVGATCFVCRQRICRACERVRQQTLKCVTFEARMEQMERAVQSDSSRSRMFSAIGVA